MNLATLATVAYLTNYQMKKRKKLLLLSTFDSAGVPGCIKGG